MSRSAMLVAALVLTAISGVAVNPAPNVDQKNPPTEPTANTTPTSSAPARAAGAASTSVPAAAARATVHPPSDAAETESGNPAPESRRIEYDGVAFELANSTSTNTVQTDEYLPAGEKLADWTEIVTVQRVKLTRLPSVDDFLSYFQRQIQTEDGATLDILKSGQSASVFAVRFPKSDRNDEQVMICLAFVDAAEPARLNIVQYALKPARLAAALLEKRIQAWRDRLLHQAQAMAGAQPTSGTVTQP